MDNPDVSFATATAAKRNRIQKLTSQLVHYARRESRLVTRSALAKTGYKLRLESSLLAKFLARDTVAEAFEALIGAVYVDSSYNLQKVEDVLDTINFENVQIPIQDAAPSESDTNKETQLEPDATLESQSALPANAKCEGKMNVTDPKRKSTPTLKQKRKLKQQAMLEQRNALQSQKTVDKICSPTGTSAPEAQATDIPSAGSLSVLDPSFESISDPSFDFRNIYQEGWLRDDIRKRIVMFEKKTIHRCNIVTSILSSLLRPLEFRGQYWHSLVLPPEERKTSEMKELDAQQRCDMFWNSMFGSNEKKVERVLRSPRAHSHLTDQFRRITGKDSFQWSEGNLFQHLCEAGLQPRDAFLASCRIEDEVRDIARNEMGLPDWYDLPEQQGKILPPWRVAKEPGVASEEVETVAEWWKSSEPGYSFLQDESAQKEQDTEDAQKADNTPEDGSPENKQSWDPIRPTTQEQQVETLPNTATTPDDTPPTPTSRPRKSTAQDNALPLPPLEPAKQDIPPPAFQSGNLSLSNPPPHNPPRSTNGGEDLDNPSERSKIEAEQREEAGEQGETLAQEMNKHADTHIDGAEDVPKEERGQESYLKRLLRTILGKNNV